MGAVSEAAIEAALALCIAAHPIAAEAPMVRLLDHAQAESRMQQFAVGVDPDRQRGLPAESHFLASEAEAIALIQHKREVEKRGVGAGLMQISHSNWERMGLTYRTMFRLEENLCAGARILGEAYVQVLNKLAACIYNSGRDNCRSATGTNGYPESVIRARITRTRIQVMPRAEAQAPPAAPPPVPMTPQPFDLFERHRWRTESPKQETD